MDEETKQFYITISKVISGAAENLIKSDPSTNAVLKKYWESFNRYPEDIRSQVLSEFATVPINYNKDTFFSVGDYVYIPYEWDPIIAEGTYKPIKKVQIILILSQYSFLVRDEYKREFNIAREKIIF